MFNHVDLDLPQLERETIDGVRYYQTPEGNQKLVSITSVISYINRQIFIDWRKKVGAEEADKITRKATSRGTDFHTLTENHLDNGIIKLKAKNLDMVVINDVSNSQIGFESDYNQVKMITKNGNISSTEIEPKRVIAGKILDELSKIIK